MSESTTGIQIRWDLPRAGFLALAAGLPLVLLAVHAGLGHQGDLRWFYEWAYEVSASPAFYRRDPMINYPIIGVLVLWLPAWLWEHVAGQEMDFATYRLVVKGTLALVEIGFVLVVSAAARALGILRPRFFAICLYALPAIWAGGAWFGQIDVVGSSLLLLAAWGAVRYALAYRESALGWLTLALLGLLGAVLTKQLTLFSVPGVLLMIALGVGMRWQRYYLRRAVVATAIVACSPVALLLPDVVLTLPDGYRSHLAYVLLGGGSAHGDVLSGNGANVWAWLSSDPSAPSTTIVFAGLSAKQVGVILFCAVQLALLGWLALEARQLGRVDRSVKSRLRETLGSYTLYLGMSNLAMATLLTGVHERYLYCGVPFLLLGLALRLRSWGRLGWWLTSAAWIVCGWSGLFVLSSIHWNTFGGVLAPFRSHTVTGMLELGLLVTLLVAILSKIRVR